VLALNLSICFGFGLGSADVERRICRSRGTVVLTPYSVITITPVHHITLSDYSAVQISKSLFSGLPDYLVGCSPLCFI